MKKSRLLAFALLVASLTGCYEKKDKPVTEDPYQLPVVEVQQVHRDTILVGHLGEETAMSSLQVITDECDTISIAKTSTNGNEGVMIGEVRNYEDRVMVMAWIDQDGNAYLNTFLNITQLKGKWKNGEVTMELINDSVVRSQGVKYTHWKIDKCKLLLIGENNTEFGMTQHADTASINTLYEDSLHISIPRHGKIKLGRCY